MAKLDRFREVWIGDFEFGGYDGKPDIRCAVFHELHTGRTMRLWVDELRRHPKPPFDIGPDTLFVAHYASAELNCFRELGWPFPANVLDTFVELRRLVNGRGGASYLDLLAYFGEDAMSALEKEELRVLAMRGGPYTEEEKRRLLAYCERDVIPLAKLLPRFIKHVALDLMLNLDQYYIKAISNVEGRGIPLDAELVGRFIGAIDDIKILLPHTIDPEGLVFEGTRFVESRFLDYVARLGIPWPFLETGSPDLQDDTFRQLAKAYPKELGPIHETRYILSKLNLQKLVVCPDGRNRCLLGYYGTITSRNTPSNAKFIFGSARWARSFIRPGPGMALAYLDWSAQEYRIAARLSGDPAMLDDCKQGDPYIHGAIRMGLAPAGATKASHPNFRAVFKVIALASLYGMGPVTLSARLGAPVRQAVNLLALHKLVYRRYWEWSNNVTSRAWGDGCMQSLYGWRLNVTDNTKHTSLMNWHIQTGAAEMLRIAFGLAEANGVRVIAPVHDAALIEAPVEDIQIHVAIMRECMELASAKVLGGFRVPTSHEIVTYPDRYRDEKDREALMWPRMLRLLERIEQQRNNGKIILTSAGLDKTRLGVTQTTPSGDTTDTPQG
jgi:DNA polymerase-1